MTDWLWHISFIFLSLVIWTAVWVKCYTSGTHSIFVHAWFMCTLMKLNVMTSRGNTRCWMVVSNALTTCCHCVESQVIKFFSLGGLWAGFITITMYIHRSAHKGYFIFVITEVTWLKPTPLLYWNIVTTISRLPWSFMEHRR